MPLSAPAKSFHQITLHKKFGDESVAIMEKFIKTFFRITCLSGSMERWPQALFAVR